MKNRIFTTSSEKETFQLGQKEGAGCRGGEVYLLLGDLGAGKTKFTQGLASGLGVRGLVNSPTFNILKLYKARGLVKTLCHVDAYRLNSSFDLEALGIQEFLDSKDTVTVIEWAEKVKKIWPHDARVVEFRNIGADKRKITFSVKPE